MVRSILVIVGVVDVADRSSDVAIADSALVAKAAFVVSSIAVESSRSAEEVCCHHEVESDSSLRDVISKPV